MELSLEIEKETFSMGIPTARFFPYSIVIVINRLHDTLDVSEMAINKLPTIQAPGWQNLAKDAQTGLHSIWKRAKTGGSKYQIQRR